MGESISTIYTLRLEELPSHERGAMTCGRSSVD
jgi:hypothetical protein